MSLTITRLHRTANDNSADAKVAFAQDTYGEIVTPMNGKRPPSGSPGVPPNAHSDDGTNAVHGLFNGVLLAVPFWGAVGLLIRSLLR